MENLMMQCAFFLDMLVLLAAIAMHLPRKNAAVLYLYVLQSIGAATLLFTVGALEGEKVLMIVALITLVVKAIAAPLFFRKVIHKTHTEASSNNYFSTPVSLLIIMGLLLFAYSDIFTVFSQHDLLFTAYLPINFAVIFISFFLMYNRRGALGQILGILSFENGVVVLAALLNIAQPIWLEIGIVFDLVLWIVIAQVFIAMVYKQFGTLNVTEMRKLTEE